MKNTKTIVAAALSVATVLTTTISVMALGSDTTDEDPRPSKTQPAVKVVEKEVKLILNRTKLKGTEGKKVTLKSSTNSDEKVTYRSTNKKVATVSKKGVVKLVSEGSAKIVAETDGVKAVCKVNVDPVPGNSIKDSTMADIASEIGCQTDYAYGESTIMCSAYSFAYAYYQVTGTAITPGRVWCGGCTWTGGSYLHCGSAENMLSTIKEQLDQNRACVGLLSMGSSATHYVTFYGYTGDGTTLSDFKILDPWEGNLTTGDGYGYSYDGCDVVVIN